MLEEAIDVFKRLRTKYPAEPPVTSKQLDMALQLGIEALERLSKLRNRKSSYTGQGLAEGIRHDAFNEFKQKAQEPLPSEDEERR